ncbi:MAG: hypothetical protein HY051_00450 [Candidatus Aenigmarchaeota archaeon]|nr:hypothetical protein [Candidatus Aenigmarchaeota archaeon]
MGISSPISNEQNFTEVLGEYAQAETRTSYMDVTLILRKDGSIEYISNILKTIIGNDSADVPILTHYRFDANSNYDNIEVFDLSEGVEKKLTESTKLLNDCNDQYMVSLDRKEVVICKQPMSNEIHFRLNVVIDADTLLYACRELNEEKFKGIVFKNVTLDIGASDYQYRFTLKEFGDDGVKLLEPTVGGNALLDMRFIPTVENGLNGYKIETFVPASNTKYFFLNTQMVGELKPFVDAQQRNNLFIVISILLSTVSIGLGMFYRTRKHAYVDRQSIDRNVGLINTALVSIFIVGYVAISANDLESIGIVKLLVPIIIALGGIMTSTIIMNSSKKIVTSPAL